MKLLHKISAAILLTLCALLIISPVLVQAATFRTGDTVTVTEPLTNLYISGGTLDVTSRITNDLVAAGGTIRVDGDVTNSILVAGGTITLSGNVGNTVRAAGGTVTIENVVRNDLVVAGGTIEVDEDAQINGDLVVTGGTVRINGPVSGNVYLTGGEVELNNTVGGNVWGGEVGSLRLGPNAAITGDLNYTSENRARIADGAVVNGQQNFKQADHSRTDKGEGALAGLLTAGTLYKLAADIIVTLFFIWLLPRFFSRTNETIAGQPLLTGVIGFGTLVLMPIMSLLLLVFLWLGIASFLLYLLLLIVSVIAVNVFVGSFVLRWWYNRDNKNYVLDWKAGVIGPLILTVLWFIPVLGWFVIFILWLLGIGSLVMQIWYFVTSNQTDRNKPVRESSPASHVAKSPASKKKR